MMTLTMTPSKLTDLKDQDTRVGHGKAQPRSFAVFGRVEPNTVHLQPARHLQ